MDYNINQNLGKYNETCYYRIKGHVTEHYYSIRTLVLISLPWNEVNVSKNISYKIVIGLSLIYSSNC